MNDNAVLMEAEEVQESGPNKESLEPKMDDLTIKNSDGEVADPTFSFNLFTDSLSYIVLYDFFFFITKCR